MEKQVDYSRDIAPLGNVFVGVYEKANIYEPYSNEEEAVNILNEEYLEAEYEFERITIKLDGMEKDDLLNVKHSAFSCIFELLQVIAVSNKYLQLLERKEADRNGDVEEFWIFGENVKKEKKVEKEILN